MNSLNQISLFCRQNKSLSLLCTNIDCKNSCFLCYDINCQCSKQHEQCKKINWSYLKKKIDKNISKNTPQFKKLQQTLQQSYKNMIGLLTEAYKEFKEWKNEFGLTEKEKQFIRLIQQKQFNSITGEIINQITAEMKLKQKSIVIEGEMEIKKQVQKLKIYSNGIVQQLKKLYNKTKFNQQKSQIKKINKSVDIGSQIRQRTQTQISLQNLMSDSLRLIIDEPTKENIKSISQELNEQTLKLEKIQLQMDQKIKKIENQIYIIKDEVSRDRQKLIKSINQLNQIEQVLNPDLINVPEIFLNSETVLSPRSKQQIKINSKIINKISQISGFFKGKLIENIRLLYRASQNSYSITKFHELCDKIPDTIVIAKTEFGKIIGGYTPIMWDSEKHTQWQTDSNKQTFLFSITENSRIDLMIQNKCILQRNDHGPIFGSGATLLIANKSNDYRKNHCSGIGSGFKNELFNSNNQKCKQKFSGQKQGHFFKIMEWEVFRIKFSDRYRC